MAKMVRYINREGEDITKEAWASLRANPEYFTVRSYDNGAVFAELRWNGKVDNPDTFEDYYPVYILLVKNYREDGTQVNDPVDGDKTFAKESEGLQAYEDFLMKWTECEKTEAGQFIEKDNALVPPSPDAPVSAPLESVGCDSAW